MVKIVYCDRCGGEIKRTEKWQEDGFGDFDDLFEEQGDLLSKSNLKRVTKVQVCENCLGGYNKIIDETNKRIKSYLKEGKIEKKHNKEEKYVEKKKGWFGL